MKFLDAQNKELMTVSSISHDGPMLIIKGKIFGTMPMTAKLSPEEARKAFKFLSLSLLMFLATFLFRSSQNKKA